jgi:hypothetical protein
MADSTLSETDHSRSLRERVLDIFRTPSSPSFVPRSTSHTHTMSDVDEPARGNPSRGINSRTPLLRSYDRREPPCGMGDSCDHGTFTPRVVLEEHPGWHTNSMPDYGGERSRKGHHSRQSTSTAPSVQGPENIPLAEASASLPVKHSKSLYVNAFDQSPLKVVTNVCLGIYRTTFRFSIGFPSTSCHTSEATSVLP